MEVNHTIQNYIKGFDDRIRASYSNIYRDKSDFSLATHFFKSAESFFDLMNKCHENYSSKYIGMGTLVDSENRLDALELELKNKGIGL